MTRTNSRIRLFPGQTEYRTGACWFMIEKQADGTYWLYFFGGHKCGADSYPSMGAARLYADSISRPPVKVQP